jgi:hypothetical protein
MEAEVHVMELAAADPLLDDAVRGEGLPEASLSNWMFVKIAVGLPSPIGVMDLFHFKERVHVANNAGRPEQPDRVRFGNIPNIDRWPLVRPPAPILGAGYFHYCNLVLAHRFSYHCRSRASRASRESIPHLNIFKSE